MRNKEYIINYIEENIELLEEGSFNEFFVTAPAGTGYFLYEADISFIPDCKCVPEYSFLRSPIKSIVIPGDAEYVGISSFEDCAQLEEVTMLEGVKVIDSYAFHSCSNLVKITLPKTLHTISETAFGGNNMKTLEIIFNGTMERFKFWLQESLRKTSYICKCSDGSITHKVE